MATSTHAPETDKVKPADEVAENWLNQELNLVWLVAERCLRQFQRAKLRPGSDHPSLAEIEAIFAARRAARVQQAKQGQQQVSTEEELSAEIDSLTPQVHALRQKAPIGRISDSLGLTPMELQVLITVSAPHFDPPLVDVFSVLRGPQNRRGVDLALVAQMLRLKRPERIAMLDVLDPERPLVAWRLLQLSPPETPDAFGSAYNRVLQPNLETLGALCGRSEIIALLGRYAQVVQSKPTLDDLVLTEPMRTRLMTLCTAAEASSKRGELGRFPWPVVCGARGAGKRELAARLAAFCGRPLFQFDLCAVTDKNIIEELLRRAEREALLRGAILYIGPLSGAILNEGAKELATRLDHYPGLVVLGVADSKAPRMLFPRMQEIELGLLGEPELAVLWDRGVPKELRGDDLDLPQLSRAYKLTAGEVIDTTEEACSIAALRKAAPKVTQADLRSGVERRLRNELGEFAMRIKVRTTWEDLVLPKEQIDRVQEFIARMRFAHKVYQEWGFGRRLDRGKGMIALFSGPPGTGKTMLAGLIANDLGLDMYQVDLAQVVSKWVGETEKQLSKVFDQAERAHAVLLFDEADSLFAKRTEVKSSNDRYGNLAVNYLLQRLESYTGVAIMTTNKDAQLDEGLQRRLNMHLRLDIPEIDERKRLWSSLLPDDCPRSEDVDFEALANRFEMSGGYIKNAVVRAAFLAAQADAIVTQDLLAYAAALELEDQGRVVLRFSDLKKAVGKPDADSPSTSATTTLSSAAAGRR